jgi:hypothetical protein
MQSFKYFLFEDVKVYYVKTWFSTTSVFFSQNTQFRELPIFDLFGLNLHYYVMILQKAYQFFGSTLEKHFFSRSVQFCHVRVGLYRINTVSSPGNGT